MTEIDRLIRGDLKLQQVCIVVRNLDKSMKNYQEILGIEPWKVHDFDESNWEDATYHGKPAKQRFRVALGMSGTTQVELIQPLDGDNIYSDFLAKHGEGLHHLGHIHVDSVQIAIQSLGEKGVQCLQSGRITKGSMQGYAAAYMDTVEMLGTIIELVGPV